MKCLTDEIRNNIISLLDSGQLFRQIEARIGES